MRYSDKDIEIETISNESFAHIEQALHRHLLLQQLLPRLH